MRILGRRIPIFGAVALLLAAGAVALKAQEPAPPPPTPAQSQSPVALPGGASVIDQISPTPTVSPSPSVSATPLISTTRPPATRSIRINFLPPPLEGTISLGIYDGSGKLVRVLHQEAEFDEFTVGDDALSTKWDGRDDNGSDLPPGKYQAHGFAVGKIKNETVASSPSPTATPASDKITVRLMSNPLGNDAAGKVELGVGFDDESSFLKTTDGLPLYTISDKPNLKHAGIARAGERSADVWQDDGTTVQQFRLSNLDKMMAFDCGDFQLK